MAMMNRRSFVAGSLAASALTALAACGKKSGATSGEAAKKSISYYINDPVAIDPYNTQESEGTQVEHCLFDSLVTFDWSTESIAPLAAESWEVNDDATQFTFHLVKGAKFHNGDTVDAESFKRGWTRLLDPNMATPGEIGYHLDPVVGAKEVQAGTATELTGVTCPDENTLVVKLTGPMADFLYVCAHPALAPVPKAALDDPASFLTAPIGNGPFKMDGSWVSGQYINVVKFDDYYGEKPKIDAINFSIQKDPDTAYREFEAGNIDFCQIPNGQIATAKDKYGVSDDGYTITPSKQVLNGAEMSTYYLIVNLEDETMAKKELRQAISLAINRTNIVNTLYEGTRIPANCIFPQVLDNNEGNAWEYCPAEPDVDRAKKLIQDNGLEGTTIRLCYNSGGSHENLMSAIQGDLEAIGLVVKQETQEWAAYLKSLTAGDFQLGRLGWIADYPTLDNFIYPNFYSTADNNYSKYNNPEVDAAVDAARKITDEAERKDAYRKINQMIANDMPIIPIMFYSHIHVGSSRLSNFYYSPQILADVTNIDVSA